MAKIKTLGFDKESLLEIGSIKYANNWPLVYIINNGSEAYIGETTNAKMRMTHHLANDVRSSLTQVNLITDETFNKSSVLNLESFLIKYMAADNIFRLQNGNGGIQNHDYFQKEIYESKFKHIWNELFKRKLVKNKLQTIENSDLFKYSPYKSLSEEQYATVNQLLTDLAIDVSEGNETSFVVEGGAGTGKTILGIYLIKLIVDAFNDKTNLVEDTMDDVVTEVLKLTEYTNELKIGLVIPMDNLRSTLKRCFRGISGLNSSMVLSPNDVVKHEGKFDLLIVDEAHRLRQRKNLTQYKTFDDNNSLLGLGSNGTELDWILLKSKHQILFYDRNQSIKPTDVRNERFEELRSRINNHSYFISVQMRCLLGGNEYVSYVKKLFSNDPPIEKQVFKDYEFKIFDDVNEMVEAIKQKDKEIGLSRTIAGFAWAWMTKKGKAPKSNAVNSNQSYDIDIDGHQYIWNTKAKDWINSPNSVNEIGSIHTTQGFDLNYTGLIIGKDLRHDKVNKKIYVDRSNYYDVKGKNTTSDEELLNYVFNIYSTMCLRGMRGTYLYICDEDLREYFKRYIN